MSIKVTVNVGGDDYELSGHFEVCTRCDGRGHVDHPAFSNGISGEEFANEWTEEEREQYLSGFYDVRCPECGGKRVVGVPDWNKYPDLEKQYLKDQEADELIDAMYASERRMGA